MSKPVLYVFAISHYCEKARWALDYLNIDYKVKMIAPGVHIKLAKKFGLDQTSVPILKVGKQAIQGSAAIISWAEKHTKSVKSLTPTEAQPHLDKVEKRLDDIIGVHVRRYYYSETLLNCPETVRPLFLRGIPLIHKFVIRQKWPMITALMIKRMDLGAVQRLESRDIVDTELLWLDGLLANDKTFLFGNSLSRADITAASLLAPLVSPEHHPTYAGLTLPPHTQAEVNAWSDRPSIKWVRQIYNAYR